MPVLQTDRSLPDDFVAISAEEGFRRLARSQSRAGFFALANQFRIQTSEVSCGATSAAIVLNALRYGSEKAPLCEGCLRAYTPENVFTDSALHIKPLERIHSVESPGLELEELHQLLKRGHGVQVEKFLGGVDDGLMFSHLLHALSSSNAFTIVNFARENGGGHFSPLAAYDNFSDSYLILDVNPSRAPWGWVPRETLFAQMATADRTENRGALIVFENE